MDANGSKYQLLLGESDWASCMEGGAPMSDAWNALGSPPSPPSGTSFYWDPTRNQITLWPQLYVFAPTASPLTPADRRGTAADRFGNVYLIDPTQTQILVTSAGDQTITTFWPPASAPTTTASNGLGGAFGPVAAPKTPAPRLLSGLAVTERHYLVVGCVDPGGLLIFDLYRGGPPEILLWPSGVPFVPFDMAARPGGGVFILDSQNKRYWSLDADFGVSARDQGTILLSPQRTGTFQPLAGSPPNVTPARGFPQGNLLDLSSPLLASAPIAIEALPDGSALVLDLGDGVTSYVERYHFGALTSPPFPVSAMAPLLPAGASMSFLAQDFAFVPSAASPSTGSTCCSGSASSTTSTTTDLLAGVLLVALASGAQSLAFTASSSTTGSGTSASRVLDLVPLPDYYPMRSFGGRAIFYANGSPYYDFAGRFVPLVMQKKPQYVTSGTLTTPVFDSQLPGCVWNRLILEAALPVDTTIVISSRAADDKQTLSETPFLPEPPQLYPRAEGTELPYAVLSAGLSAWELLFQQARGRYLQLQITFTGNARSSPRIRALRAHYPRFSYVKQYMPATYTDNDTTGLLDRFMANFEGLLTPIEDRIASAQELFDPRTAPYDTLEWLGAWFGVSMDPAWDDVRQRLFLRHAMDLFQWRGTVRGIQMALDLVLSSCPCDAIFTNPESSQASSTRIVESFALNVPPAALAGEAQAPSIFGPQAPANTWTPAQGGNALLALWQAAATAAGLAPQTSFPTQAPTDAATDAAWTSFTSATLGFVPSATTADLPRWTQFLLHRYQSISNLNSTYDTQYASLSAVPLPSALPPDGAPLFDWYQFEGIVLPTAQSAHRFRVMIPLPPGISSDLPQQQQQLDLITRLVNLEKPAHTVFDVGFYWAMFSVGQARLGTDTLLDQGGRMPQLAPSMVLGYGYLLQGHLAPGFPQDATYRDVLGRDSLGRPRTPRRRR
jgi:phage tail-like protein